MRALPGGGGQVRDKQDLLTKQTLGTAAGRRRKQLQQTRRRPPARPVRLQGTWYSFPVNVMKGKYPLKMFLRSPGINIVEVSQNCVEAK